MAQKYVNLTDKEKSKFVESPTRAEESAVEVTIGNPDDISAGGSRATTLTVYNVSAPTATTEYSQALTTGTKKLSISSRDRKATIQFTFTSGESGTKFITIPTGASYSIEGLNLTGETIYFQTNKASQTIEIEEWT